MFQNTLIPPLKVPHNWLLFKPNATMNYCDSQGRNNEYNYLNSYFSFFVPLLKVFEFIYFLKITHLMKV